MTDDLGSIGQFVGPRKGLDKRTHGEKEDYVLRRLITAWRVAETFRFPVTIRASAEDKGTPDFRFDWGKGEELGVEVTEAGDPAHQAWMTKIERLLAQGKAVGLPETDPVGPSERTIAEIVAAIQGKVADYDAGYYRVPAACDLAVYDNTALGGFLAKWQIVRDLVRPSEMLGRFKRIHFVFESHVVSDVFGNDPRVVDLRTEYEIDYAEWIAGQVKKLADHDLSTIDAGHIAEELADLGRAERNKLGSHLENLLLHLLKWQFQATRRGASWKVSIRNARIEIERILEGSPSLVRILEDEFSSGHTRSGVHYERARQLAADETELPVKAFPEKCPYTLDQLVDPTFLPEGRGHD
ncbi:MAG: DUF29 domain-containing protein [Alphaproteobacteria bacterium]|nr:DUF29 domain-containing protein [Alphaproteobacteria bacterium]